jgi:hypothetical protein
MVVSVMDSDSNLQIFLNGGHKENLLRVVVRTVFEREYQGSWPNLTLA